MPLFKDFAEEFLRVYAAANNKPSERRAKEMIIAKHLVPFFGTVPLDCITAGEIERYKAHQVARPKTINNRLTVLRKILGVAVEWGRLGFAPKFRLMRVPSPKFRFLTFDEADKLIAAADPMWRPMITFALRTGLRRGELLALRWEDVDLAHSVVNVQRSIWNEHEGTPKGGRSRKVSLSGHAREALRLLPSRFKQGYVFGPGDRPLRTGEVQYPLIFASREAGLKRVGWHVLRHTYASHLVMRNVPIRVIQEMLGHATIEMTLRYTHVAPAFHAEAVNRLDEPAPILGVATEEANTKTG